MYILALDMRQSDCPFIDTSEDFDVSYLLTYFDFQNERALSTRFYMSAPDPEELQNCLESLGTKPKILNIELLSREGSLALLTTTVEHTNAMDIIKRNHGYIVGPFTVKNGREVWRVGFDKKSERDNALYELEKTNDFKIRKHHRLTLEEFSKVIENLPVLVELLNSVENMTLTEKLTLRGAIKLGFYDDPRKASIKDLSEIYRISRAGVSKNIRRAERRIMPVIEKLISTKLKEDLFD
ncbi:helix-turn-helix domain-containing protein [Archaeoglobus neptunius]|uniref:helix-turn-helix domain-containing protein n=1 Tax=Archaeoglobus neptunius TaxID=2798580 RepID=UPI001926660F|nr:helix-turn-helix domain-containing protein [Archaeoglobus neptunius]